MIQLDDARIQLALPLVAKGIERYCWLQSALPTRDVASDHEFQVRFNAFYRVRRAKAWRVSFYRLLESEKSRRRPFEEVLRALHVATGKVEASFASKLVASVDPDLPVIDRFVLDNLGLRLPRTGTVEGRLRRIVEIHNDVQRTLSAYLNNDPGRRLVAIFEAAYPGRRLTGVKMLDLILWQAR